MKCYFCFTAPDKENSVYVDLLEVSLKSAAQNTTLDLYALYDGPDDGSCYELLKKYHVTIIKHRFSHEHCLDRLYPEDWKLRSFGKIDSNEKISGAFMRLDIPFVESQDEYVLYADIDVMFLSDIKLEELPHPRFLAAGPEFEKSLDMTYFNSGVLVLNVPNMREKCLKIFNEMEKGRRESTGIYDQGYLNQFCFQDMEHLPLEYNWKPYWGYNPDAKIIHFHGMKPGGEFQSSGFALSKNSVSKGIYGGRDEFGGYLYYILLYFNVLGKESNLWVSNFFSDIYSLDNNKLKLRMLRYRKRFKLSVLVLIVIALFVVGLVLI